ncbi:hypothetical protein WDZ17_14265 [Pseudokineococcus basanitobsidens]|uniref:DUF4405 domain-containing protein n=1 Tax=Pseudokineococcus basanitobsidens TaxID=1926649 RepID=A0ABU8RNE0_9ACTN
MDSTAGATDRARRGAARRPGRGGRRRSTTALLTAGLLASAVIAFVSHELGATVHSVISLAVVGVVAAHVVSQRRWLRSAARRRLHHPERVLVVYNLVLAASFVVANVSGAPVWFWDAGGLVAQVHDVTGVLFLLLVLGHLTLNGRRLLTRLRGRRPQGSPVASAT